MKQAIFFLFFFSLNNILVMPSLAQQWEKYTSNRGLIDNSIQNILEDHRGYLWFISSFKRICQYDGVNFISYNKDKGLSSNNIYKAIADEKGNVWFATDNGIIMFNGNKFQNFYVSLKMLF